MKKSICKMDLLCAIFCLAAPAFALTLAGNQAEITTDPCAYPHTLSNEFDFSSQLVVWIDSRDETNYVPRIYASFVNDENHTEYLIDACAIDASAIKTDGRYIAYTVWIDSMQTLRIADVNNINHPVIADIAVSYIDSFDIDNGVVVFKDIDVTQSIYAVGLCDPCRTKHKIKEFIDYDYIYTNISVDGNTIVWSGEFYDDVNSIYCNYLDTADITDLANPVVARNILPVNSQGSYAAWINALDISGDWLIARGTYNDNYCVFGIHNYYNPQNWSFVSIREMQDYRELTLRVDAPYVVWVENDMQQTEFAVQSELSDSQSLIAGAVLLDNGRAIFSILKSGTDPNWSLTSACVSGDKIVWSANYYRYYSETENYEIYNDIFSDTLLTQCGDKGYSIADLNKDCKVDFADFAMMAEHWLVCTLPNDESCVYGEVFEN